VASCYRPDIYRQAFSSLGSEDITLPSDNFNQQHLALL